MDSNGELLGNLIAPDGSQAKSLADITYGDARTGKVKYLANGEMPDSTQQISITVSKSDEATVTGTGSVVVQCHILPPRYAQCGVSAWSDSTYDHLAKTICAKGCALSSQAMMMTAFGDTIKPYALNAWMVDPVRAHVVEMGGYGNPGLVSWSAPALHSGGSIVHNSDTDYHFVQMWEEVVDTTSGEKSLKLLTENQTNPSVLDAPLSECKFVIVRVYNSDTGNSHWVLVTGKENGRYTIMDPGDRNEQYLDEYGGFWTWVEYAKRPE